jgi:hypothetical protein
MDDFVAAAPADEQDPRKIEEPFFPSSCNELLAMTYINNDILRTNF